jgi:hypothetical protein
MTTIINVLKFLAGAVGTALFFYRNSLFAKFAKEGTSKADLLHTVVLNNHGSYGYITIDQSNHLNHLEVGAWSLIGLMIVIDLLQRRFFKRGSGDFETRMK